MPSSPISSPDHAPRFEDVEAAAERIAGIAVSTPLLESSLLNQRLGGRLLLKAEVLQRTGSFKFRGAYNRICRLDDNARRTGVVAYSSGNHAQAVAAAARLLDLPAVIVMPRDAPAIKIEMTRAQGAEIVFYDRLRDVREAIGARLAAERDAILVPPYEDRFVIAGQGTIGLELADQAEALRTKLDAVLVPCGGGGLLAGGSLALAHRMPGADVLAVEPEGYDDTARSLAAGHRITNAAGRSSFCDALLTPIPGEITFSINARLASGGLTVTDDQVADAMAAAFQHLKLIVEPGGAVALAAVLSGRFDARGKTVAVVCSGGNVDSGTFAAALRRADESRESGATN